MKYKIGDYVAYDEKTLGKPPSCKGYHICFVTKIIGTQVWGYYTSKINDKNHIQKVESYMPKKHIRPATAEEIKFYKNLKDEEVIDAL